jgi:hypothetical protein
VEMLNNQTRLSILLAYCEKKFEGTIPKITDFHLFDGIENQYNEAGYHIMVLKNEGLLSFEGDPFEYGGQTHPKYDNRIIDIEFRRINITPNGEKAI